MKRSITIILLVLITLSGYSQSVIKIKPKKLKASSLLSYNPVKNIIDGRKNTHWQPLGKKNRDPKAGIGNYINFEFDRAYTFKEFAIYNGAGGRQTYSNKSNYLTHNRPSEIKLTFGSGKEITFVLEDISKEQVFKIPDIKASSIKMTVTDKILGTTEKADHYSFMISEVSFSAIDPIVKNLQNAIDSNNKKTTHGNLKALRKRGTKLSEFEIKGYKILEYAIRSGKPDITDMLLADYTSPKKLSRNEPNIIKIENANIDLLTKQNTNEDYVDFAKKMMRVRKDFNVFVSSSDSYSIPDLEKYKSKLSNEFKYLFTSEKEQLNSSIDNKINGALEVEMKAEGLSISKLPIGPNSIDKINSYITSFNSKYGKYKSYPSIQSTIDNFQKKKGEFVAENTSQIIDQVQSSESTDKLESISYTYLSNTSSTVETREVRSKIGDKIREIKYEAQQAQLAKNRVLEIQREKAEAISQQKAAEAKEKAAKELKVLMDKTTPTGEPTEWQIKFAINYQMEAKFKKQENMANIDANDGLSALMKLMGMATSGTSYSISSFEKYGCVKAEGKPGFACDYVADININGGLAGNMLGGLAKQLNSSEIKSARFSKVKGIWMLVEYLD